MATGMGVLARRGAKETMVQHECQCDAGSAWRDFLEAQVPDLFGPFIGFEVA